MFFKRLLTIALAILLCFVFTACDSKTDDDSPRKRKKKRETDEEQVTETVKQPAGSSDQETTPAHEERGFSVESRISGEMITAEDGKSVGIYRVRYKSMDSEDTKNIPVPDPEVRLPGEYTYYDIEPTDHGIYYSYLTASRESNAEKYWNLLAEEGFTCRPDPYSSRTPYYYASKDGYAEIFVKDGSVMVPDGRSCITIYIPNAYHIERENTELSDHFSVKSSYLPETLRGASGLIYNDKFVVRNFTGDAQEGTLILKFTKDTYSAGDWFSLNDYLMESNKYPISKRSCEILCESLSTEKYDTLSGAVTGKHNYEYFDEIDVEILEYSSSQVVIYYYVKVSNEIGTTCEVEGIISSGF